MIESAARYYLDTDDEELNGETNNNKINQKVIGERKTPKKLALLNLMRCLTWVRITQNHLEVKLIIIKINL